LTKDRGFSGFGAELHIMFGAVVQTTLGILKIALV